MVLLLGGEEWVVGVTGGNTSLGHAIGAYVSPCILLSLLSGWQEVSPSALPPQAPPTVMFGPGAWSQDHAWLHG